MNKIIKTTIILGLWIGLINTGVLAAGNFSLSNKNISASKDQTFTVGIILNTGADNTTGAEVGISYSPSVLKAESVSHGSLYQSAITVQNIDNTAGRVTFGSSVSSTVYNYQGTGTLGTITFKALTDGTSPLRFDCVAGSTIDASSIWKGASGGSVEDILDCSATTSNNGTVTVGGGTAGGVAKYKCSGTSCVRDDANGTYTSSTCNNGCSQAVNRPKYKCSGTSCIWDDTNGVYYNSTCDNKCGVGTSVAGQGQNAKATSGTGLTKGGLPVSGISLPAIGGILGGLILILVAMLL